MIQAICGSAHAFAHLALAANLPALLESGSNLMASRILFCSTMKSLSSPLHLAVEMNLTYPVPSFGACVPPYSFSCHLQ